MSTLRLARYLARAGVASRRGAAALLQAGRVTVNGRAPSGPGDPVDPASDEVRLDGRPLRLAPLVWLALHKPPGLVTSKRATPRHPSVYGLLADAPDAIVTVGRLDVYSEGLLLCTTDGDAAHRLMHPRWQVPRTYRVAVVGSLGPAGRAALEEGVRLEGEGRPVAPAAWTFEPAGRGGELQVTLREGRSRVVRRMCAALGLGVRRLTRTGYGPVQLGALPPAAVRPLSRQELTDLLRAIDLAPAAP